MKTKKTIEKEPQRRDSHKKWKAKLQASTLINQGWSREDIIEKLREDFEYSEATAQTIYYAAQRNANKAISDYINEAAKVNVQRLISIIDAAFAEKKYGDSLKAIDTLNKMGGLYSPEQVDVNMQGEPIKISFE